MGVLSFPIQFLTEADARAFVRRVSTLLETPCLVRGAVVHIIVDLEDFDTLAAYAGAHGGHIQYGATWNFQWGVVTPR